MNPKVSIVVPCYGVEKYLDRCMKTLVNQSLRDIEIILVDDVSSDRVPQMCDEWAKKDARIKVIHKTKNEGLGLARNTGLEIATGEYVAFVDSDDFVDVKMYDTLYRKATETNADAVYCNCMFYKDEKHQRPRMDVTQETVFEGRKEVDDFLLDVVGPKPECSHDVKYMMSVWHAIFRKELFDKHNIRFVSERQLISEDLVFDIDYLYHCNKVVYLPEAFYYYCDNGASLSRKVNKTRYERNKQFLVAIEEKLSAIYPRERYILHFQRQQIHRLISSISQSIKIPELELTIKSIINDNAWRDLWQTYPFRRMNWQHRLYFFVLRTKCLRWLLSLRKQ